MNTCTHAKCLQIISWVNRESLEETSRLTIATNKAAQTPFIEDQHSLHPLACSKLAYCQGYGHAHWILINLPWLELTRPCGKVLPLPNLPVASPKV